VFEYSIKDHLGNQRIMFSDADGDGEVSIIDEDNEVMQEVHYCPFGMNYDNSLSSPWYKYVNPEKDEKFQYNGKEVQDETFLTLEGKEIGLGWLDFGFRFYDPAIGRFTGVDPISDQFPHLSTFNYASNDPVLNIDLHGLQGANSNDFARFYYRLFWT